MTAYYFRVVEDGKPNGWVGFVVAPTLQHLFWAIDEFVDPFAVEIQTAKFAGYCYHMEINGDDVVVSKHETSESDKLFFESKRWRKPIWVTDKNFDTTV
jgi:hypothetical protein